MMPAPARRRKARRISKRGAARTGRPSSRPSCAPIRPRSEARGRQAGLAVSCLRGEYAPPERKAVLGFLGQAMPCLSLFRPSSAQDTFHVRNPIWNRWLARTHSG